MAKTKIEVERYWNAARVRIMCIKHERYTCGDNEAYEKMLLYVDNHKPNKESIFRVAEDIVKHSDLSDYGCDEDENIAAIMFDISRECVTEHFKIHREA